MFFYFLVESICIKTITSFGRNLCVWEDLCEATTLEATYVLEWSPIPCCRLQYKQCLVWLPSDCSEVLKNIKELPMYLAFGHVKLFYEWIKFLPSSKKKKKPQPSMFCTSPCNICSAMKNKSWKLGWSWCTHNFNQPVPPITFLHQRRIMLSMLAARTSRSQPKFVLRHLGSVWIQW